MKFVTVREFRNKPYIDIREFYEKDGDFLPGKKGERKIWKSWWMALNIWAHIPKSTFALQGSLLPQNNGRHSKKRLRRSMKIYIAYANSSSTMTCKVDRLIFASHSGKTFLFWWEISRDMISMDSKIRFGKCYFSEVLVSFFQLSTVSLIPKTLGPHPTQQFRYQHYYSLLLCQNIVALGYSITKIL